MKIIKVVPNWLKWRENWSEIIFPFFDPPHTELFCQKWKKSKSFKITWNGEKIGRKWVFHFLAPTPKKMGGRTILFVKNEKNQSSSGNIAASWPHLASWNLQDFQLNCKSFRWGRVWQLLRCGQLLTFIIMNWWNGKVSKNPLENLRKIVSKTFKNYWNLFMESDCNIYK